MHIFFRIDMLLMYILKIELKKDSFFDIIIIQKFLD